MYNNPQDAHSKLSILKTFIRYSGRDINVFCTFNLGRVSTGKRLSKSSFFSKNQIILAQTQCSYFFSGFQAHFFLLCSCHNCQTIKKGITVRGWGDSIEPEDNANTCSSSAPLVSKINQGSIPKWLV